MALNPSHKEEYATKDFNSLEDGKKRFKFIGFSERIAKINVDVFHRLTEVELAPSESDSFFHETLIKWLDLNRTTHYAEFVHEINPYVQSLPQILLHKRRIINTVLRHLRVTGSTALAPLLELLAILARDLRQHFVKHFEQVVTTLVELLDPSDPILIEQVFSCIGYLFKFLQKQLVVALPQVWLYYSGLLAHKKPYIRHFAAESFAYLLRRVDESQLPTTIAMLFQGCYLQHSTPANRQQQPEPEAGGKEGETPGADDDEEQPIQRQLVPLRDCPDEFLDGLAYALFYSVKGVKLQFHSRFSVVVPLWLGQLSSTPSGVDQSIAMEGDTETATIEEEARCRYAIIEGAFRLMAQHTSAEHAGSVWRCIAHAVEDGVQLLTTASKDKKKRALTRGSAEYLARLLQLAREWAAFKHGKLFDTMDPLFDMLSTVITHGLLAAAGDGLFSVVDASLSLLFTALLVATKKSTSTGLGSVWDRTTMLLKTVFALDSDPAIQRRVFNLCRQILFDLAASGGDVPTAITSAILRYIQTLVGRNVIGVLGFLSEILPRCEVATAVSIRSLGLLLAKQQGDKSASTRTVPQCVSEILLSYTSSNDTRSQPAMVWAALQCVLPLRIPLNPVQKLLAALDDELSTPEGNDSTVLLYATTAQVLAKGAAACNAIGQLTELYQSLYDKLVSGDQRFVRSAPFMRAFYTTVEQLHKHVANSDYLSTARLAKLISALQANLSSPFDELREYTLRALALYQQPLVQPTNPPAKQGKKPPPAVPSDVVALCLTIETTPLESANEWREITLRLQRLAVRVETGTVPEMFEELLTHFTFGVTSMKLSLLWEPARNLFVELAKRPGRFLPCWRLLFARITGGEQQYMAEVDRAKRDFEHAVGRPYVADDSEDKAGLEAHSDEQEDDAAKLLRRYHEARLEGVLAARFTDYWTWESMLWKMAMALGGFIERNAEARPQLVQYFLDFMKDSHKDEVETEDDEDKAEDGQADETSNTADKVAKPSAPRGKNRQQRLENLLELFSGFQKPHKRKDLSNPQLPAMFLRLIGRSFPRLQQLAFRCLMAYRPAGLLPYKDHLERLVNDTTFREELTLFNINVYDTGDAMELDTAPVDMIDGDDTDEPDASTKRPDADPQEAVTFKGIKPQHRPELVQFLTRLLFGKLFYRTHRGRGNYGLSRRAAILAYLTTFETEELADFIALATEPFTRLIDKLSPRDIETSASADDEEVLRSIDSTKQIGYLTLLDDIVEHLGAKLGPRFISMLLRVVLRLLRVALRFSERRVTGQAEPDDDVTDRERTYRTRCAEIKNLCFHRVCDIVDRVSDCLTFSDDLPLLLLACLRLATANLRKHVESISMSPHARPPAVIDMLVRLSRHRSMVLLIKARDPGIFQAVLECLAATPLSNVLFSAILQFTENLAALAAPFVDTTPTDDEGRLLGDLLRPHITELLDSIQRFLRSLAKKGGGASKAQGDFSQRAMAVLAEVSRYSLTPSQAEALVVLLLPFLSREKRRETARQKIVAIIRRNIPHLSLATQRRLIVPLSDEFQTRATSRAHRTLVCEAFEALSTHIPSLAAVAPVLFKLNAYSKSRVDEYDYEVRLKEAFPTICGETSGSKDCLIATLPAEPLLPIVCNFLHFMYDDDLSIRNNASYGLLLLIRRTAQLEAEGLANAAAEFNKLLARPLVPAIIKGMKAPSVVARKEFVGLISELARFFGGRYFPGADRLYHPDSDQNFFENIVHIQRHRRIRALQKLQAAVAAGPQPGVSDFTEDTIQRVYVPLVTYFVVAGPDSGTGGAKSNHNLVDEAVRTIGVLSSKMRWPAYVALLQGFVKRITEASKGRAGPMEGDERERESPLERVLVKQVVEIANHFHFEVRGDTNEAASVRTALVSVVLPHLQKHMVETRTSQMVRVNVAMATVRLLKLLPAEQCDEQLPKLLLGIITTLSNRSQVTRDTTRSVLSSILAYLGPRHFLFILQTLRDNLCKGFQKHVLQFTVHTLLRDMILASPQLSQDQSAAADDAARQPMAEKPAENDEDDVTAMDIDKKDTDENATEKEDEDAMELPELTTGQRQRPRHTGVKIGELDVALPLLLDVLLDDLLGATDEQRAIGQIANSYREAKSTKSYDSFELISRVIDFSKSIHVLLGPVREVLDKSENDHVVAIMQTVLKRIFAGLSSNPSIQHKELCIFVYKTLVDTVDALAAERKAAVNDQTNRAEAAKRLRLTSTVDNFLIPPTPRQVATSGPRTINANSHLFAEFALSLFYRYFKKRVNLAANVDQVDQLLPLLDPFVPLLVRSLTTKYDKVLSLSVKSLSLLLPLALSSFEQELPAAMSQLFTLLKRVPSSAEGLVADLSKMLAHILHEFKAFHPSNGQLRQLVRIATEDVKRGGDMRRAAVTFSLVKALIGRRVLTVEFFDLMKLIAEQLVRSPSPTVRQQCSQVFLLFTLHYPMTEKRLAEQFNFLLRNLDYDEPAGREQVLEFLNSVFVKFPLEVLEANAEFFFLPLVVKLANEEYDQVRRLVVAVIKSLIGRLAEGIGGESVDTSKRLDSLFRLTLSWYTSTVDAERRTILRRAAAHVLLLLVDVLGPACRRFTKEALPPLSETLRTAASNNAGGDIDTVYYTIATVDAMCRELPHLLSTVDIGDIWLPAVRLLTHKDRRVQTTAAALVGKHLGSVDLDSDDDSMGRRLFGVPGSLFVVAKQLAAVLDSPLVDHELGGHAANNLLVVAMAIMKRHEWCAPIPPSARKSHTEDEVEEEEKEVAMGNGHVAENGEETTNGQLQEEDEVCDEENEEENAAVKEGTLAKATHATGQWMDTLHWLFRRLSFIARRRHSGRSQEYVFRWFALMVNKWAPAAVEHLGAPGIDGESDSNATLYYLEPFLVPMLSPLYRAAERILNERASEMNTTTASHPVQLLAAEVIEMIKAAVGMPAFSRALEHVRGQVTHLRQSRKQKRVLEAVMDPERAARRKIKHNAKNAARKKRKLRPYTILKERLKVRRTDSFRADL